MDIINVAGKLIAKINTSRSRAYAKKHKPVKLTEAPVVHMSADRFCCGFSAASIMPFDLDKKAYMMAGFAPGIKAQGVHDPMTIRALWLGVGEGQGILWLTLDAIGMTNQNIAIIRERLADFCSEIGCFAVNVSCSHSHAGLDTTGYWGRLPLTGKDKWVMEHIYESACAVAKQAYMNRTEGKLMLGSKRVPQAVFRRREPCTVRDTLTRLRFVPHNGSRETWLLNFSAHPNTLGGDNRLISADYPYYLRERINQDTPVNVMFTVGAIGSVDVGMYSEDRAERTRLAGEALGCAAMTITNDAELKPEISFVQQKIIFPDDNDVLTLLSHVGVMDTEKTFLHDSSTGFGVVSEMTYMTIDSMKLLLLPGELFPELAYGGFLSAEESATGHDESVNPKLLKDIVDDENLVICGVTNDMTGYVVPPNDFILRGDRSCLVPTKDRFGRGHYHETNSLSVRSAEVIADTLESLVKRVKTDALK